MVDTGLRRRFMGVPDAEEIFPSLSTSLSARSFFSFVLVFLVRFLGEDVVVVGVGLEVSWVTESEGSLNDLVRGRDTAPPS